MKGKNLHKYQLLICVSALVLSHLCPTITFANPEDGVVTSGSATIETNGNALNIHQHSDRTTIDWRRFNIDAGELTEFHQPSSNAIALNRVRDMDPSYIHGTLRANGNVVLINPNGVFFSKNARVDVNGLIATTADIDNADFMNGSSTFDQPGNPEASIINEGTITARDAGLVGLVAPQVLNHGIINAKLGRAHLASGDKVTVDFYGNNLLEVAVSDNVAKQAVTNTGTIIAEGGTIAMTAAAGRQIVDRLVTVKGELTAPTITQAGGKIIIGSGHERIQSTGKIEARGTNNQDGGTIAINGSFTSMGGTVDVSGKNGGAINIQAKTLSLAETIQAKGLTEKGGTIDIAVSGKTTETTTSLIDVSGATQGGTIRHVAGQQITTSGRYIAGSALGTGGHIDVSAWSLKSLGASFQANGETGGGTIRLGGEYQGGKNLAADDLPNAHYLVMNDSTKIHARALGAHGDGGTAILWSDALTIAVGSIDVTPGSASGLGGFVEVSSAEELKMGANVLTGIGERQGSLLLDPKNITIANAEKVIDPVSLILGYNYNTGGNAPLGFDAASNDYFGSSVALDGNRLAVGAYQADGISNNVGSSGEVYLYLFDDAEYNGGQLVSIIGKGYTGGKNVNMSTLVATDNFGRSLSLSGNNLAVGAYLDDGVGEVSSMNGAGAVHLFTFTDDEFNGGALAASIGYGYNGANDINITSLGDSDQFGYSVSLDGNRLAVGANYGDDAANGTTNPGEVYLFNFADDNFTGGVLTAMIGKGYAGLKDYNVSYLTTSDYFGSSLSLDGNRLAVGAINDDGGTVTVTNSGSVYLFSFTSEDFDDITLEGVIGANYMGSKDLDLNLTATENFGHSVSLDGNRLAVGATLNDGADGLQTNAGAVYLFSFSDALFSDPAHEATIGKLFANPKDINYTDIENGDNFGYSVALDGNRLVVGTVMEDGLGNGGVNTGNVSFFSFDDSTFSGGTLEGKIGYGYYGPKSVGASSLANNDYFGYSLSLDGNRLAVGAKFEDGFVSSTNSGTVYLFTFADEDFTDARLTGIIGSGYTGGNNVDVTLDASDEFGASVSLNGRRLAVGATGDDSAIGGVTNVGAVYLFNFTDDEFSGGILQKVIGKNYGGSNFDPGTLDAGDLFGSSVSLDGNRLAVGAQEDDGAVAQVNSGAVYLFSFDDDNFTSLTHQATLGYGYSGGKNFNLGNATSDYLGAAVSLSGNSLAIGASSGDGFNNTLSASGDIYLVTFTDDVFSGATLKGMIGYGYTGTHDIDMTPHLASSDQFGYSLDLDGTNLIVGAFGDDGGGGGPAISNVGSAYVFRFDDQSFNGGEYKYTIGAGYNTGDNIAIAGLSENDYFGASVSMDDGRIAIGAYLADGLNDSLSNTGDIYLFKTTMLGSAPVSDGLAFSTRTSDDITIMPSLLTAILNGGTAVTLQASNDITLNEDLIINNAGGNGGWLTLQAGRSILLNADINTDNGNLTLIGNDLLASGVIDAQRDTGNAIITMASGVSINAGTGAVRIELKNGAGKTNAGAGDIILRDIAAGSVFVRNHNNADIVSASGALTASGTSTAIELVAGRNYINNAGAGALDADNGDWLIYSTNVTGTVNEDLLAYDFRRYSCNYADGCAAGVDVPANGNGLYYSYTPQLGITVTTQNKEYDGTSDALLNAASLSGIILGDSVSLDSSSANATFADEDAGNNKIVTAIGYTLSGTNMGYSLAQPTGVTANITPKAVTITGLTADNKEYDRTNTATLTGAGTLNGFIIGDNISFNAGSATFSDEDAGDNKTVTATGFTLTGADKDNYTLTQPGTWLADITPKALTISGLTADNKEYDRTNTATLTGTGILNGFIIGDTVGYSAGTATFSDEDADTGKTVTATGFTLTGANKDNYTLAQPGTWLADITPKALTITGLSAADKEYDRTNIATLIGAGTLDGFIIGDTVGFNAGIATFNDEDAGTGKTVTATSFTLTGADKDNYTLTQPGTWLADITPKALTITGLTASDKEYDRTNTATLIGTGILNGFIIGDTVGFNAGTATFNDEDAGDNKTVAAIGFALTGADKDNYTLTQPGTWIADITPKEVTIIGLTASDKEYDRTNTATLIGTGTLNGFIIGDTVGFNAGTATFNDEDAGDNKTVTATGFTLTGADKDNYTLTQPGTWLADITPKALTITGLTASDKEYDRTNTATLIGTGTLNGFIIGDTVGFSVGSATFSDEDVSDNKTVTATAFTLTGADKDNYTLAQPGTWIANITPKALTITGLTAENKIYDGTLAASLIGTGILNGFIIGDTVSFNAGTAAFNNKDADDDKTVIATGFTLTGADKDNYTLIQPGTWLADITKAVLTVTLTNPTPTREEGQSNPGFGLSYSGFVLTENAGELDTAPTADTTATLASAGGTYNITLSGGSDNNYSFSYGNPVGVLTVTAASAPPQQQPSSPVIPTTVVLASQNPPVISGMTAQSIITPVSAPTSETKTSSTTASSAAETKNSETYNDHSAETGNDTQNQPILMMDGWIEIDPRLKKILEDLVSNTVPSNETES